MAADDLSALVPLAVRLHLDSTSYSNALPGWIDPIAPDYPAVEEAVARRLTRYLAGDRPARPFEILVPAKGGAFRTWLLPAVADQILLSACAASLAGPLAAAGIPEPARVWSYRLNDDPDRLLLTRSQIRSWVEFQDETRRRLAGSSHLLQIDLERAFGSVDRMRFLDFLRRRTASDVRAVELLATLLDSSVVPAPGLPMINDSLSFLGNAYLHVVDEVFRRSGAEFIRFVDDYRVFGASRAALEGILTQVTRDLRPLGFRVNPRKLRLGTGEEYLEAVSKLEPARTKEVEGYISAAIFEDMVAPEPLAGLVERALFRPDEIWTEGFGRFLIGALRRQRVNEVATGDNNFNSPRRYLLEQLDQPPFVAQALALLRRYASAPETAWQAVSILYLMADLPIEDLERPLRALQAAGGPPEVVALWIDRLLADPEQKLPSEVRIFEADYLEAGRLCRGPEAP